MDDFIAKLRSILSVEIPKDVNPYSSLYGDLGLDSFQAFELIVVTEDLAECIVPPLEIVELYTLADAFAYYRRLKQVDAELLEP